MTKRLYRGFATTVMIFSLVVLGSGCGSRFTGRDILRVAVVTGSSRFDLGATDKIVVRENKRNRKIFSGNPAKQIKVASNKRGITFGNKLYRINGFSVVPRTDGSVSINGKRFRGNFKVMKKDGALWVVNYVNIEDYLKTVVPSEVSPSSDIDSLKARQSSPAATPSSLQ